MHEISKRRFDILAAYARSGPMATLMGRELAWFESDPLLLAIATLMVDTDGEFVGVVLAPDRVGRYRAIHVTGFHERWQDSLFELQEFMERVPQGQYMHAQGDESSAAIDFFAHVTPERKWHPTFRMLREGNAFSAAREVISALMRWHDDVDGNFVEQFQTRGFDARVWELYVFSTLTEAGLDIHRPDPAPDFVANGLAGTFAIEATTINPAQRRGVTVPSAKPVPGADTRDYYENYLPIRYAGPLTAKLAKRYWDSPASADMPLVFAIQDFHDAMSMAYSGQALATYLYGRRFAGSRDSKGNLIITPTVVTDHVWGSKTVPSGFFTQADSENIAAIIFNTQGTLSKFNRMGVQAGFGSDRVHLVHSGIVVDPDPRADQPMSFGHEVTSSTQERWIDGMDVFHNPNAICPLDPRLLPGAAHHRLLPNGLIETTAPENKIITSTTAVITATND